MQAELTRQARELLTRFSRSGGQSMKVRLNRENMEYLYGAGSLCGEDAYYDGRAGLYLRAVLEEYAALEYAQREKIFFQMCIRDSVRAVSQIHPQQDRAAISIHWVGTTAAHFIEVAGKTAGQHRTGRQEILRPLFSCRFGIGIRLYKSAATDQAKTSVGQCFVQDVYKRQVL